MGLPLIGAPAVRPHFPSDLGRSEIAGPHPGYERAVLKSTHLRAGSAPSATG